MTLADSLSVALTWDSAFALRTLANDSAAQYPGSVFCYARMKAFDDIATYFDSDQGIPTALAERLNAALRDPISRLVQGDELVGESPRSTQAHEALLTALARL